jgi:hypothetical protein
MVVAAGPPEAGNGVGLRFFLFVAEVRSFSSFGAGSALSPTTTVSANCTFRDIYGPLWPSRRAMRGVVPKEGVIIDSRVDAV